MRFVDDDIQPIRFVSCRIFQRFPDGIGTTVAMLDELAGLRQFLRIQKINRPIAELFLVK